MPANRIFFDGEEKKKKKKKRSERDRDRDTETERKKGEKRLKDFKFHTFRFYFK